MSDLASSPSPSPNSNSNANAGTGTTRRRGNRSRRSPPKSSSSSSPNNKASATTRLLGHTTRLQRLLLLLAFTTLLLVGLYAFRLRAKVLAGVRRRGVPVPVPGAGVKGGEDVKQNVVGEDSKLGRPAARVRLAHGEKEEEEEEETVEQKRAKLDNFLKEMDVDQLRALFDAALRDGNGRGGGGGGQE